MTGRLTMVALSAYFLYLISQFVTTQFEAIASVLR
jgi:hypothetical protein